MTTAVASRFNRLTHKEALMEADARETWLVDGLISATSTLVYGEAKVGKSFLMSAMIAALVSGDDYLGRSVPQDRELSVAVCWTDDGGAGDYASQIRGVLPEEVQPPVDYYMLPAMRCHDDWQALYEEVISNGNTLVVIDNLTQALNGSINHDEPVRDFFDGVRLFTRSGIPVVIVGHSSDKSGDSGWKSDKPMGNSAISQSVRWRCFVKRSRKGNLTLTFSGNYAESHEITVKHGAGARFEVIDEKSADTLKSAGEAKKRDRDSSKLAEVEEMADWIVENAPAGSSQRDVAGLLADKFGGSAGTYQSSLSRRDLSGLVRKDAHGVWVRR
ncbi:AAA family ATPase [Pseudonocardia humida]|uniref:AAA family ATPase n=1 Tax=Pseudonocardia humida TaxID=2800819 RepID=A0ABT1A9H5_9PSEU|nr:AAA family ATPase [Pseudonocardia humida]MCO1659680.1 AAA family ATPase [Pseudonocardia humida]